MFWATPVVTETLIKAVSGLLVLPSKRTWGLSLRLLGGGKGLGLCSLLIFILIFFILISSVGCCAKRCPGSGPGCHPGVQPLARAVLRGQAR